MTTIITIQSDSGIVTSVKQECIHAAEPKKDVFNYDVLNLKNAIDVDILTNKFGKLMNTFQ